MEAYSASKKEYEKKQKIRAEFNSIQMNTSR